jgi:dihydroorotase-like cyclic amidohydrolase
MIAAVLEDDWDEQWAADAVATIVSLSLDHESISADDLRREMRPPNRPAQYGAAFRSAQAQGLIESIASHKSTSKTRNHGRNLTWRRKQEGVGHGSGS